MKSIANENKLVQANVVRQKSAFPVEFSLQKN